MCTLPDEKDEEASGITDKGLLIKTLCVLTVVIVLFLSGSIPGFKLTLGEKFFVHSNSEHKFQLNYGCLGGLCKSLCQVG